MVLNKILSNSLSFNFGITRSAFSSNAIENITGFAKCSVFNSTLFKVSPSPTFKKYCGGLELYFCKLLN